MNKKIMFFDDERSIGNPIMVTLNYGWCFEPQTHVKGFDTKRDALDAVRSAKKCGCVECVENTKKEDLSCQTN